MSLNRVTVIGLGLMGGSLALALRRAGVARHIVGCGRAELLRRAQEMGAINSGSVNAVESVVESDFVFLCAPVQTNIGLLQQIAPALAPHSVVSDVGSTKSAFAAAAREIFGTEAALRVLPGHPIAGKELSGLVNASADLFEGCVWALTPVDGASQELLPPAQQELVLALQAIGSKVVFVTPEQHDRALAYTSHLPQMVSSALALALDQAFAVQDPALQLHGNGLRGMLRLAASDPQIWEQIAAGNHENLAQAMECMENALRNLRELMGTAEFRKKFEQARGFTSAILTPKKD